MLSLVAQAQSYVDQELQQFVKRTIIETIKPYGNDVSEASCVIMRSSGEVLADVGLGLYRKTVKDIPTLNSESISPGITRPVLYLALMDGNLPPDYVINTGSGEFCDSATNCIIRDMNYTRGGWGKITVQKAVDVSTIGVYKAVENVFKRNMSTLGRALIKTGITFNTEDDEPHANSLWLPCDIMGAHSPFSMYQQTAWISGVMLNQGKIVLRLTNSDSPEPVCTVKSSKAALDALRQAMIMTVQSGSGRILNTPGYSVGAALNVSERDALNCKSLTGFATISYGAGAGLCVGVYVRKHDAPAGRKLPLSIVKAITDFVIQNNYLDKNTPETVTAASRRVKLHPAEKGR
jgi:hypothetical protein